MSESTETGDNGRRVRDMSDEHKAAIAQGRIESGAVRDYLDALEGEKRKPGRQVTPEGLEARLAGITERLADPTTKAVDRLGLIQGRRDTEAKLEEMRHSVSAADFESDFVQHARSYAGRKGISYATWREFGVPANVLRAAGIAQTR